MGFDKKTLLMIIIKNFYLRVFLSELKRCLITAQKQQCGGRRHQDSSCSALIDSHHSCAPSIWGVDNKLINERSASVAMRHRLSPCHKSKRASEAIDRPSIMCQVPAPPLSFSCFSKQECFAACST